MAQEKVHADVATHGWHVVLVLEDEHGPPFGYTIGLAHTFGHPEVIFIGQQHEVTHSVLNSIGDAILDGQRFEPGDFSSGFLEGYDVAFRAVHPSHYPHWVGQALRFYDAPDFPLIQCLWPGRSGKFPWDVDGVFGGRQPVLERPWPFAERPETAVLTTRPVLEEAHPILLVTHDDDGDWQFLCGTTNETEDARVISLVHAEGLDPSLAELADLPRGWRASRKKPGGKWTRRKSE